MSQDRLKVVNDNPEAVRRRRLWTLFAVVVSLSSVYIFGLYEGKLRQREAQAELAKVSAALLRAETELKQLRQSFSIASKRSEIDRLAADKMRQQIATLSAQIASQQEDITFYQHVMTGQKAKQSLRVEKVAISNALEPSRYRYQVVLAQVAKRHPWIKGKADISIIGLQQGKKESYSLKRLNDTLEQEQIPFKFRYFQKLEGELQIPDGFEPEYVQVRLTSQGRSPQVVEGQFPWSDIKGA